MKSFGSSRFANTLNEEKLNPKGRLNDRGESFDLHPLKMREMRFSKAAANESPPYSTKERELHIYSATVFTSPQSQLYYLMYNNFPRLPIDFKAVLFNEWNCKGKCNLENYWLLAFIRKKKMRRITVSSHLGILIIPEIEEIIFPPRWSSRWHADSFPRNHGCQKKIVYSKQHFIAYLPKISVGNCF